MKGEMSQKHLFVGAHFLYVIGPKGKIEAIELQGFAHNSLYNVLKQRT
jgi:hypothetical protein